MSFPLAQLILLVTVQISSFLSRSKFSSIWPTPASSTSSVPFLTDPLPSGSCSGLQVRTGLSKLLSLCNPQLSPAHGRIDKPPLPQVAGTHVTVLLQGRDEFWSGPLPNRSSDLTKNKNFKWFYWKSSFHLNCTLLPLSSHMSLCPSLSPKGTFVCLQFIAFLTHLLDRFIHLSWNHPLWSWSQSSCF